jgi:hypothetical protein
LLIFFWIPVVIFSYVFLATKLSLVVEVEVGWVKAKRCPPKEGDKHGGQQKDVAHPTWLVRSRRY